MASSQMVLCKEHLQCSICEEDFLDPVSLPCAHKFCKECIEVHWDMRHVCECPRCKQKFPKRPELHIDRNFAEITEQFKRRKLSSPEECSSKPGDVPCDVCTGRKLGAVKSCLVCLASYCETHIQPHYQAAAFKRHRLIDPVDKLEDRLCEKHEKLLELFCRTDQTCVCQFCTETDHRTHSTVTLEEECRDRKAQVLKTKAEVQQMIQERLGKVEEIKYSLELSRNSAQKEIKNSVQVFTALMRSIERSQTEFIKLIEERQRTAERRAEGIIQELEQEITELKRRNTELEKLSHTKDHIYFLQRFLSTHYPPLPKDWSDITVPTELCLSALRQAISELTQTVWREQNNLSERELEEIKKYAVDVSLDPRTAGPHLALSEDGKEVRYCRGTQTLPDTPERFSDDVCVLGREGFTSGKHYWEAEVRQKTDWAVGVAKDSVKRKGEVFLYPDNGYWTLCLSSRKGFEACTFPPTPLSQGLKPRRVGVYVDYEEGQISFYNLKARCHIYTFRHTFSEKLYPFFDPCLDSSDAEPLILCPVNPTEGSRVC